jgi:ubiquinone/menaquinone biosynthesis C-methylase UbiE
MDEIYTNRKLSQRYPDLDKLEFDKFTSLLAQRSAEEEKARIERLFKYLNRLVDLSEGRNVLVVGCGPKPLTIKTLVENSYNVVGIEPTLSFVHSAREYLGSESLILEGSAENLPVPDHSQHLVLLETVMEHVDSPINSLTEIFRVLAPGGICYISTVNRYRISLSGENGEFNVKYYNWFPEILKECFVFHHLHYEPHLSNYAQRPAVHWYTYAELCKLGRYVGFSHFYSLIDLLNLNDESISKSKVRRFILNKLKYNPWLRALALTQAGDSIIMFKRTEETYQNQTT